MTTFFQVSNSGFPPSQLALSHPPPFPNQHTSMIPVPSPYHVWHWRSRHQRTGQVGDEQPRITNCSNHHANSRRQLYTLYTHSLLLKAANQSPRARPSHISLAVPRDGTSTLNYLYGNTTTTSTTPLARLPAAPPSPAVRNAKINAQNKDPGHLPARMSLTESIKVWIWLTVDIAFDIPRYVFFQIIKMMMIILTSSSSHQAPAGNGINQHAAAVNRPDGEPARDDLVRDPGGGTLLKEIHSNSKATRTRTHI